MECRIDERVFTDLLASNIPHVYSTAFRLCADRERAEDTAQQTLMIAWQKRGQLSDQAKITHWLRKICINLFLESKRREGIFVQPEDGFEEFCEDIAPAAVDEIIADESVRELQDGCFTAMASQLSLGQRGAFILVEMFGLTLDESARSLGISLSSLKSLLFRARKNMNAFFGHHCQWVLEANPCSCSAWLEFAAMREKNKDEVRRVIKKPDFCDPAYAQKSDPATLQRVIALFRNLPQRRPDSEWYQKTAKLIGSLL